MGLTMEQRLKKEQLMLADRAIITLLASTKRIEIQEGQIISWITDLLLDYTHNLAEARRVGKISAAEGELLFDEQSIPHLYNSWESFVSCLSRTRPLIDRLAFIDCETDGKGLVVHNPRESNSQDPVGKPSLKIVYPSEYL